MRYIPQLDAIRAIAVILVLFGHWMPGSGEVLNRIPKGAAGVNMFFVLSGFLITKILLENRKKAEGSTGDMLGVAKNFVIRRAFRIFPVYYLTITLLLIFSNEWAPNIVENIWYYYTYTANILYFIQGSWDSHMSHLWSLAVEEQFYLFWPWIILFLPKKYLEWIIVSFIFIGISCQVIMQDNPFGAVLTPSCFDALGLGALLAFLIVHKEPLVKRFVKFIDFAAIFALTLLIIHIFGANVFVPIRTIISILALWLISYCLYKNNNHLLNTIFKNKSLIFIGKISYGIYLYHSFIPKIWIEIISSLEQHHIKLPFINLWIPDAINIQILFIQQFCLLILFSWVSWIIIEKPINGYKKYFEYVKKSHP